MAKKALSNFIDQLIHLEGLQIMWAISKKKIKSIFKGHLIQFLQPTQGNFYNLRAALVLEVGMWLSLKEQS